MKSIVFCLISLIFCIEIYHLNGLECYSCLSTNPNTTGCHDQFNSNGTSISTVDVRTSDAICTKLIGKLSNNIKFTIRNGSVAGCPQGLESSVIVGNDTTVQISDLKIYCCNTPLCNQATNQRRMQWIFILPFAFPIITTYFL